MSRTPASFSLTVVRGATWEDDFTYTNPDGSPFDLTGYQARMQVRTLAGQFGLTQADTLVLELSTAAGSLVIAEPENGVVAITVPAADTEALNPANARKVKLCYSLELFKPAGADPEYVIPLVAGKVTVQGETTR
ncbi:hypothetical protein DFO63_4179 [Stenotrophomonas sp. AG209]|uniref:hypothetical protein n=1 Tax=Stenotrophomonas sp. AG209 TaxID=2183909 RepID=UPI000E5BB4E1|nr:hypothetical protein [Stenotrophomonas sp. AG209]RIA19060.1 hypothetical protein DFO63_4179 [Stenotrophomonas sp. AG209]